MRIGVIGVGAIGGTIASLLHRVGHDVSVTARGSGLDVVREHGIRLDGAWGSHLADVSAAETLTSSPELAFVCTKAQDAAAAIEANAAHLRGVPVVVAQNGLEGITTAQRVLPDSPVIGALALYAANYTTPGRITVTAPGVTYLGAGAARPSQAAREAADVLAQAMPARTTANFVGGQWTKLIINQVNAMPAITGMSVQQTIADRRLRLIITSAMREAVRIGIAAGIRFGSLQGLSNIPLRLFAVAPRSVGRVLPMLMSRRMGATPNLGSTLQSVRRGQATEIDYLNGAVTAAAERIGRLAPLNDALVQLVHEVESSGDFFDADTVAERVPLR